MSKHRFINVSFWQDAFVLELTPEEKYFYLYLMTNSKTSQCGIYELPYRVIELETGYHRETVVKLLDRFVDYNKIEYCEETREIYLKNWAKFNWNNSIKVISRVESELAEVKHKEFVKNYVDTVNSMDKNKNIIQYPYTMDSLWNKEKEKEKGKKKERKEKEEVSDDTVFENQNAFDFYQKNGFGVLNPHIKDEMGAYIDDFKEGGNEIVINALKISLERNKISWGYAKAILKNWLNAKLESLEEVEAHERNWISNKTNNNTQNNNDRNDKIYSDLKTTNDMSKEEIDRIFGGE